MRSHIYAALCLALLFVAPFTQAWSKQGHTALGDAAERMLSKKERHYYQTLATEIGIKNLAVRDLSAWVDSVRGEPLQEVFKKHVPVALQQYKNRHTSTWHYQNMFYDPSNAKNNCRVQDKGKLESTLLALNDALTEDLSKRQEAIVIAFAMHLIEDAHQPLHAMALLRRDCSHDRGGNLYCLQSEAGRCVFNLHQLWDKGFGVPNNAGFMNSIQLGSPSSRPFKTEIALMLAESQLLTKEIYSAPENRVPHPSYITRGKEISQVRLTKAAQRVAHFLKRHYENKR